MAKEAFDLHTASLEMKGGLASNIDYPANYMHAPKSAFPTKYKRSEDMSVHGDAMRMVMKAK